MNEKCSLILIHLETIFIHLFQKHKSETATKIVCNQSKISVSRHWFDYKNNNILLWNNNISENTYLIDNFKQQQLINSTVFTWETNLNAVSTISNCFTISLLAHHFKQTKEEETGSETDFDCFDQEHWLDILSKF